MQLDPGRPYLDSSPSSGLHTTSVTTAAATRGASGPSSGPPTPHVKRWGDPQDPRAGDIHYYNYRVRVCVCARVCVGNQTNCPPRAPRSSVCLRACARVRNSAPSRADTPFLPLSYPLATPSLLT